MTANADLAARARQLADKAPNGSPERKAYACAAVALSTTGTIPAARKALAFVQAADIRAAALSAIERLTREAP